MAQLRTDDADRPLSADEIERTLGCLLKEAADVGRIDTELLETLEAAAAAADERVEA